MKRRAARLVDQVADDLLSGAAVKERLDILEAQSRSGAGTRGGAGGHGPVLHPAAPQCFRVLVEQLNAVLAQADTIERQTAREAFRALIRKVVDLRCLSAGGVR